MDQARRADSIEDGSTTDGFVADKRPAFLFYPGDWLRDPALRACSLAARGLWIDLLSLMWQSPRRGYLQLGTGQPVSPEQTARMTGCSVDELIPLLQELENSGVFSRTNEGQLYSRRMVRDEQKRLKCAAAGKKGGRPRGTGVKKGGAKGGIKGGAKGAPESEKKDIAFQMFWEAYPERNGRKRGKQATRELFSRVRPEDIEDLQTAVENYARSSDAKDGFAKDPERFLKKDFWRDWVEDVPEPIKGPRNPTPEEDANWTPY